ncbi:MAG: L-seryl-tRNA(Sec) selenium transferase [Caldilineaceae bacterium]
MVEQKDVGTALQVDQYRKLPGVDALLRQPAVTLLAAQFGTTAVADAARHLLAESRQTIAGGGGAPEPAEWPQRLSDWLAEQAQPTLRPLINATGVILHTNLGRAPLSQAALRAVAEVGGGYSNLEYDLIAGERGSRYDHVRQLLGRLAGAEDALVVNNCAAAVFLTLTTLCQQRAVLISRGQLVEIGGGFRIPDVLRQSGAQLIEVGTTNRTHLRDFQEAITPQTAAVMRVHSSNFRQIGFVTMPELSELTELAHKNDPSLLVIDDLGSGSLLDTAAYGLAPEPMVQTSLAAGADMVTFSGDKLLGGPQAGIIVGRKELIARLRRHPMARALRVDKMTLAALDATLRSYLYNRATQEIPIWQMISATADTLRQRAEAWQQAWISQGIQCSIWSGESAVGGGSLPGETLPSWLVAISSMKPDAMAATLRGGTIPVVCRIQSDHLLFDPRTVLPEQESALLSAVSNCLTNQ